MALVIGIDGEIEFALAQLRDHRHQLAFNNTHLDQRILAMKLGDHLRHDGARHAAAHADIHLPARQSKPLLNILLRHT